jgi:DNA-binding XRE family transcriptional regulator
MENNNMTTTKRIFSEKRTLAMAAELIAPGIQIIPSPDWDLDAQVDDLHAALMATARFYRNGGAGNQPLPPLPYKSDAEMIGLLKAFRKGLNLTQAEFAELFGLDVRTLQMWEAKVSEGEQEFRLKKALRTLVQCKSIEDCRDQQSQ